MLVAPPGSLRDHLPESISKTHLASIRSDRSRSTRTLFHVSRNVHFAFGLDLVAWIEQHHDRLVVEVLEYHEGPEPLRTDGPSRSMGEAGRFPGIVDCFLIGLRRSSCAGRHRVGALHPSP